jgi:hypothetical protein
MRIIFYLLIPILFISCSESKLLSESLSKYKAPLDYLYDSEYVECERHERVSITNLSNQVLDTSTSVSRINFKLIPLLIYNYQEVNFAIRLGESSLDQKYHDFFRESFKTESERTGCYTIADNPLESEYSIEITYDTCVVNSIYQRNSTVIFLLFAYSMSFQEIGFPANAEMTVNVKLKKQNDLVFEKTYSGSRVQPFINRQSKDIGKLHSDFVTNMAESLSLNTKDFIEEIIRDVNHAIEESKNYAQPTV